jgi:hypothetical protein
MCPAGDQIANEDNRVSAATISTTNITGLRVIPRGSSFIRLFQIAGEDG